MQGKKSIVIYVSLYFAIYFNRQTQIIMIKRIKIVLYGTEKVANIRINIYILSFNVT